jgi:hypothetical protein
MVAPLSIAAKRDDEHPLPIVEVSGGIPDSKGGAGIGNLVDAKTIAEWVSEYLGSRTRNREIDESKLVLAFQFGVRTEGSYGGQSFIEAEPEIRAEWSCERGRLPWELVRDAVWGGFDRARDRTL